MLKTKTPVLLSLLISTLFHIAVIHAQAPCETTTFQKAYGSPNLVDIGFDIVETRDRGFIVGGRSAPIQNNSTLMRIDGSGNIVWSKQIPGSNPEGWIKKLLPTSDGNFIAIGTTYYGSQYFGRVFKFDENGTIIWHKEITHPGGYSFVPNDITQTPDGGYVLTGSYQTVGNYGDAFVTRLDANGNILWNKGTSQRMFFGAIQNNSVLEKNGTLFIAGASGNSSITNSGVGIITKMNLQDGNFLGATEIKFEDQYTILSGIEEKNNKFYISAYIREWPADLERQIILITDYNLNVLKAHKLQPGFPRIYDVVTMYATNDDAVIIAFGNEHHGNLMLTKISDNGDIKWKREYPRPGSQVLYAVKPTSDHGIVGVGSSSSDESPFFLPGNDIFVFKTDDQGISGDCPVTDPSLVISTPAYTKNEVVYNYETINLPQVSRPLDNNDITMPVTTYCEKVVVPTCTSIQLSGRDTICNFDDQVVYEVTKNNGCNIPVSWTTDPEYIKVISETDAKLTVQFKKSGTTEIKASIASTCENISGIVTTHILRSPPSIDLGKDGVLCENSNKTLSAGEGFKSYRWQDGSTSPVLVANFPGKYYVTAENYCHELFSDTMILTPASVPADFLPGDTSICEGDRITLNSLSNFRGYKWSTGETTRQIDISTPGLYSLKVMTEEGCYASEDILVNPKSGCIIDMHIPNAFTPDKNGLNDQFKPAVYGVLSKFSIKVYNRYGNLVYETQDFTKGWDGTFKSLRQDAGIYVWYCQYQFVNRSPQTKKGTVLLVR